MIYYKELNPKEHRMGKDHEMNLTVLHYKMNFLRARWKRPMIITSGYRSATEHIEIYKRKGVVRPPMKSWHLHGAACDVYDPQGELQKYILDNLEWIQGLDLYMEHFDHTPTWIHFQIYPPSSNKRFFIP